MQEFDRNLRKVCLLLQAFEDQGKPIDYYALDLSRTELERTLAEVPHFKHISCHGLLGTYDDGREWLKDPDLVGRPKSILHLGSSIGSSSPGPITCAAILRITGRQLQSRRGRGFLGGLRGCPAAD